MGQNLVLEIGGWRLEIGDWRLADIIACCSLFPNRSVTIVQDDKLPRSVTIVQDDKLTHYASVSRMLICEARRAGRKLANAERIMISTSVRKMPLSGNV